VLTRDSTFDVSGWQNSTVAAGDGLDQVRRLKESSGGAMVTFGGVQTLRSLVAAGLVDEYWLKVCPVAIGQGGSMFADLVDRSTLTLLEAKSYPTGVIHTLYSTS
jgi:dihydrofolate reductase